MGRSNVGDDNLGMAVPWKLEQMPATAGWVIGAVTGFDDYSTTVAVSRFLSELGDDAFRVIADLALKSAKVMVHLE